jgi:hypothetical protein
MLPAGLSPHHAGVWQCKANSLLIRAIIEIRGSNCILQLDSSSLLRLRPFFAGLGNL